MTKMYEVTLSEEERAALEAMTRTRAISARRVTRAHMLLLTAHGWTDVAIARVVGCSESAVANLRRRWAAGGLAAALGERPRAPVTPRGRYRPNEGRRA